ncbi:hypothetical protein PFAG_00304 [Plasmodium falciparum Santa Lucia]|uniref:Surface antigen n=1 Tax=Plasmodium falciparum Santa Lucia TaxID=478859 RepID=W7FVX2_PLAFA|nr:hypothetical protein PFAG_00304 [Plasmodium falciparum Santa Lucia]
MKVHYINILLFELPLNILIYNQRNHYITRTPKATTRTLCECELYAPSNYDSDPEMKAVMQDFDRQTSQRFEEYNERLLENKQKCKEQCDKEIQKIILKDKLEKQMEQELITLETKITTEDIPTCICEKSLADKTEKFCLNCGKNMGAIAPCWGLVCGVGYAGWSQYVTTTVAKAATDAGINVVIQVLKKLGAEKVTAVIFEEISHTGQYANIIKFSSIISPELKASCAVMSSSPSDDAMRAGICSILNKGPPPGSTVEDVVSTALNQIVQKAKGTADFQAAKVTAKYTSTTSSLTTGITASIIAIVIIVLIMVIIYLILRYRRKKKMKKKLQYIKLLEE